MRVELDEFSGVPNPEVDLLSHEAREFRNKLRTLPRREQAGSPKQGLGYRGLVVKNTGDEHEGYDQMVVTNGWVGARSGSEWHYFEDRARAHLNAGCLARCEGE